MYYDKSEKNFANPLIFMHDSCIIMQTNKYYTVSDERIYKNG